MEINMRSEVKGGSSSNIEVKEGNMDGMRERLKEMKTTQKDAFKKGYKNLVSLSEQVRIIRIHPMQLESGFTVKGKVKGVPQGYLEGYLHRLDEEERANWMISLSQLACLTNEAIEGVLKLLPDAESAMAIFNPPKGIETFLNCCKKQIGEMKNLMDEARVS
ncbi:hypothetical protein LR48_Vigan08g150800 [Vigna angularis]|uniref:Uncharacterized protein n=1 Tax=Phaseolus angularis TaxID=3914 RepID=A0A0L9V6K7_PHAAN|nr:hypothetical protein LR48_Vigan08g150800 [Vigna angularis]